MGSTAWDRTAPMAVCTAHTHNTFLDLSRRTVISAPRRNKVLISESSFRGCGPIRGAFPHRHHQSTHAIQRSGIRVFALADVHSTTLEFYDGIFANMPDGTKRGPSAGTRAPSATRIPRLTAPHENGRISHRPSLSIGCALYVIRWRARTESNRHLRT